MSIDTYFFQNLIAYDASTEAVTEALSDELEVPKTEIGIQEIGNIIIETQYDLSDREVEIDFIEYWIKP